MTIFFFGDGRVAERPFYPLWLVLLKCFNITLKEERSICAGRVSMPTSTKADEFRRNRQQKLVALYNKMASNNGMDNLLGSHSQLLCFIKTPKLKRTAMLDCLCSRINLIKRGVKPEIVKKPRGRSTRKLYEIFNALGNAHKNTLQAICDSQTISSARTSDRSAGELSELSDDDSEDASSLESFSDASASDTESDLNFTDIETDVSFTDTETETSSNTSPEASSNSSLNDTDTEYSSDESDSSDGGEYLYPTEAVTKQDREAVKKAAVKAAKLLGIDRMLPHCFSCNEGAKLRMIINMWEAYRGQKLTPSRSELETFHPSTLKALCEAHGKKKPEANELIPDLRGLGITRKKWRSLARKDPFSREDCVHKIRAVVLEIAHQDEDIDDDEYIHEELEYIHGNGDELRFIGGRAMRALVDEVEFALSEFGNSRFTCMFHPSCQWKVKSVNKSWAAFVKHVRKSHHRKGPLALAFAMDNRHYDVDNDPLLRLSPGDLFLYQKSLPKKTVFCPLCFAMGSGKHKFRSHRSVAAHIRTCHAFDDTSNPLGISHDEDSELDILNLHHFYAIHTYGKSATLLAQPADRLGDRVRYLSGLNRAGDTRCLVCGAECADFRNARKHMFRLHPELFDRHKSSCIQCKTRPEFSTFSNHRHHFLKHHLKPQSPYVCPLCGEVFDCARTLKTHLLNTVRLMRCPVDQCKERYDTIAAMLKHIKKVHVGAAGVYGQTICLCAHWQPSLSNVLYDQDPLLFHLHGPPKDRSSRDSKEGYSRCTLKLQHSIDGRTPQPFVEGMCSLWVTETESRNGYERDAICSAESNNEGIVHLDIPNGCLEDVDSDEEVHLFVLDAPLAILVEDEDGSFSFKRSRRALRNNFFMNRWPADQLKITRFSRVRDKKKSLSFTVTIKLPLLTAVGAELGKEAQVVRVAVIDGPAQTNHPSLRSSMGNVKCKDDEKALQTYLQKRLRPIANIEEYQRLSKALIIDAHGTNVVGPSLLEQTRTQKEFTGN